MKTAAAAGNEEAQEALADQQKRAEREWKFKTSKLSSASRLPALTDEKTIDLLLDVDDLYEFFTLEANGALIHSEEARGWGQDAPLERIARHCITRYWSRIKTFTIGGGASGRMAGGSMLLSYEQADILKDLGLKESDERICPTCGTEGVIAFRTFQTGYPIRPKDYYECRGSERHRWKAVGLWGGSTIIEPVDEDDDEWDLK